MKEIKTEIEVNAPIEEVWKTLVDFNTGKIGTLLSLKYQAHLRSDLN